MGTGRKNRSEETREQRAARIAATKANSKKRKLKAKGPRQHCRVKKEAPGHKNTVSTKPKGVKAKAKMALIAARKVMLNQIVRCSKAMTDPTANVGMRAEALAARNETLIAWLRTRLTMPDVTPAEWLDWIEGEVSWVRSECSVHRLPGGDP